MNREMKFLVYCIEIYRFAKSMTGKQVIALFRQYGISEYIIKHYEALHTTGELYVIQDIDLYIEARK